jgi:AcrR family transcriptional regulator
MTGSHNARERLVEAAVGLLRRSGARAVSMDAASAAAGAGKMSAYRHFTSKDDLVAAALEWYNPRHVLWLAGWAGRSPGDAGSVAAAGGLVDTGGLVDPGGVVGTGVAVGSDGAVGSGCVADPGAVIGAGGGVDAVGSAGVGEDAGPGPAESARRILSAFDRLESAAGGDSFRGCPFVDAALAAPAADRRIAAIAGRHKQDLIGALAGLAERAGMDEPEEVGAAVALVIDGAAVQAAVAPDSAARQRIVRRGRRIAEMLLATAGQP